jgi:phosphoribosylanthranilate isomerase
MRPSRRPRIKICCIQSVEEAWMAIEAGGAAEIAAAVPPGVDAFLLTSLPSTEAIVEQNRAIKARALQLAVALAPDVDAILLDSG